MSKRLSTRRMKREARKWMHMKQNTIFDLKNLEVPPSLNTPVRFKIPSDKSPKPESKRGRKPLKGKNKKKLS